MLCPLAGFEALRLLSHSPPLSLSLSPLSIRLVSTFFNSSHPLVAGSLFPQTSQMSTGRFGRTSYDARAGDSDVALAKPGSRWCRSRRSRKLGGGERDIRSKD